MLPLTPEAVAEALEYLTPEERAELDALLPPPPIAFADPAFAPQARFIADTSRFLCVLGTRRAAKTQSILRRFLTDAETHPGANYSYFGLTRQSAKEAAWKDGLKQIDAELHLGLEFNEADLKATTKNGATITLYGLDTAGGALKERRRGGKLRGAAVDEAQSFSGVDLLSVVQDILRPALMDLRGSLTIAGTPGLVRAGLFYELTRDLDPQKPGVVKRTNLDTATEWSVHYWNAASNPYVAEQQAEDLTSMLAINPRITETPKFVREWLGRWVLDDSNLVYRYQPGRNDYDPRTEGPEARKDVRWHYVLGIDLGFHPDPSAFVVSAYCDTDPTLYVLEADEALRLDITDVAARIKAYQARYRFDALVIDGANRQAVEEMRNRHGLALTDADKRGKADFIEMMNADFARGGVKLNPAGCAWSVEGREKNAPASLGEEYAGLVWDERGLRAPKPRREEHPSCANHGADAALYNWRHCYQYLSRRPTPPPARGSAEWAEAERRAMRAAAERQAAERRKAIEDDWGQNEW